MEILEAEFKFTTVEEKGAFSGYGSVFGGVDRGRDMMMPGAFDGAIKSMTDTGKRPKMLWQHDPSQPIGVWDEVKADDKGLKVKGRLIMDLPKAQEVHTFMKNDMVDGLSIGYRTKQSAMTQHEGEVVRQLKEVELWEISVVTFPMDPNATVTDVKQLQSTWEVERLLRKAGVPNGFAKLISLYGFEEAKNRINGPSEADIKAAEQEGLRELLNAVKGLQETFNA